MCGCNKGASNTAHVRNNMRNHIATLSGRIVTRNILPPPPPPPPPPSAVQYRQQIINSRNPNITRALLTRSYLNRVQIPVVSTQISYNADTVVWGPPLWNIIHTLADTIDSSADWITLVDLMKIHIPCKICLQHFNEYLSAHPFQIDSIALWFNSLHNDVNRRLNKPEIPFDQIPKNFIRSDLVSLIQGLSVSFPPEFVIHLQRMNII
jgi:hypothetical protein